MPSSPDSSRTRPELPWFLDLLRWTRRLADPADLETIDVVRLDLSEDLRELLQQGMPRRRAYLVVGRRLMRECGVFVPRGVRSLGARTRARFAAATGGWRRVARPALGVAAVGLLLLSAKWFLFDRTTLDDNARLRRELEQAREKIEATRSNLAARKEPAGPISAETQALIDEYVAIQDYFARVQRTQPGDWYLTGLMGLIDEELALFWEARGDEARSAAHWQKALQRYEQGAREGDPNALYYFGLWHLNRGNLGEAFANLRQAHRQWPVLGIPEDKNPGHVAADYHYALVELWKTSQDPRIAAETRPLEERALHDARGRTARAMTYQVLYNAACLRVQMVQSGSLEPVEAVHAIEFLGFALDTAGEEATAVAEGILTDPDLASLRELPAYQRLASRASAVLDEAARSAQQKVK